MYYGEIKNCDIANGTGVRISIFVSGCRNHCKGCFQPQTWDFSFGKPFTEETQRLFGEIGVEGEIYEIPADIELSDEAFKAMEEFCCTFRCEWLEQGLFRGNGRPILKAFKWNGRRFIVINECWFPQWADKWLAVRLFFKLREEDDE